MTLLLLEALGALLLLLFIVWWTMFSGRKHGELKVNEESTVQAPELNHTSPPDAGVSGAPLPQSSPSPSPSSSPSSPPQHPTPPAPR